MTPDERKRGAQAVLSVPFFQLLWDELEQAAISACINAPYNDHEKRQAMAAEARAIQTVRRRIESIANEDGQLSAAKRAPA